MTGANKVNGRYTSSNVDLVNVIKRDFGFQGCILTDWTGVRQTVEAADAGTDLAMPGTDFNWEMASPERQEIDPVGFSCNWSGILTPRRMGFTPSASPAPTSPRRRWTAKRY